jgi:hypothetical protein
MTRDDSWSNIQPFKKWRKFDWICTDEGGCPEKVIVLNDNSGSLIRVVDVNHHISGEIDIICIIFVIDDDNRQNINIRDICLDSQRYAIGNASQSPESVGTRSHLW